MPSYHCLLSSALTVLAIAATSVAAPIQDSLPQAKSAGTSGSLTGSVAIVGPDGNPVNPADTAVVSDYALVSGQSADSDDGLYLDFTSTPNPQPMRGTYGATDPGPRKLSRPHCANETDKPMQANIDMMQ